MLSACWHITNVTLYPPLVSHSFYSWFVGKVKYSLGGDSFGYHVTLTYVFSAKISPPTNIPVFRFILAICEKTIRDIEITLASRFS